MRSSLLLFSVLFFGGCLLSSCQKGDSGHPVSTIDFESMNVPQSGYWNGSDGSGSFIAGAMKFENQFTASWNTWAGFACSQKNDVATAGFTNEFSVFDPTNLKNKFAVFYPAFDKDVFVSFAAGVEHVIQSMDLCNNSYAGLSMKNGDSYSKKFGGSTGADSDWFMVTINGYNNSGTKVSSLDVYLADFRFTDASKDYILSKWTNFDLSSLGKVHQLTFTFSSSDKGMFGINTPTYVCLDNIKYVDDQVVL
ncbi:MAG: DUF4465 domain-containing protein [Prolixibacteraceae bacterium]